MNTEDPTAAETTAGPTITLSDHQRGWADLALTTRAGEPITLRLTAPKWRAALAALDEARAKRDQSVFIVACGADETVLDKLDTVSLAHVEVAAYYLTVGWPAQKKMQAAAARVMARMLAACASPAPSSSSAVPAGPAPK